jgi:hypothetical protein
MGEIMRWSYKIVHYDYKKEGLLGGTFLDEAEIEQSMNEFGQAGWELVSLLEVQDGMTATFKQPLEAQLQQRTRPVSEVKQEERTVSTTRFLRPEMVQKQVISQGDELTERDAAEEENPPVEDIPVTPLPRTFRLAQPKVEKKRSPVGEDTNGGVGSIRIE